jgi:hypothetical protein
MMKKVLIRLGLFLLPVAACLLFMEFYLEDLPNTYTWKKEMIEGNLDRINVLILGNSMTFCGIIPSKLKYTAYNLANNSQDLYYDWQLASLYIDRCRNLKYLVVPVGYASFEYVLDEGTESWRTSYYRSAFHIMPRVVHFDMRDHSALLRYEFQRGLKLTFGMNRAKLYEGIDSLGWFNVGEKSLDSTNRQLAVSGAREYAMDASTLDKSNININTRFLENIIELAMKKRIRVILVSPPVSRYYRLKLVQGNPTLDRQMAILVGLCEKYGLVFHSYANDRRFFDRDFFNIKHLNPQGAGKFTEIINDELLN